MSPRCREGNQQQHLPREPAQQSLLCVRRGKPPLRMVGHTGMYQHFMVGELNKGIPQADDGHDAAASNRRAGWLSNGVMAARHRPVQNLPNVTFIGHGSVKKFYCQPRQLHPPRSPAANETLRYPAILPISPNLELRWTPVYRKISLCRALGTLLLRAPCLACPLVDALRTLRDRRSLPSVLVDFCFQPHLCQTFFFYNINNSANDQ